MCNGVFPSSSFTSISALFSINNLHIFYLFLCIVLCIRLSPYISTIFTFAPTSINNSHTFFWPPTAANPNGVNPVIPFTSNMSLPPFSINLLHPSTSPLSDAFFIAYVPNIFIYTPFFGFSFLFSHISTSFSSFFTFFTFKPTYTNIPNINNLSTYIFSFFFFLVLLTLPFFFFKLYFIFL